MQLLAILEPEPRSHIFGFCSHFELTDPTPPMSKIVPRKRRSHNTDEGSVVDTEHEGILHPVLWLNHARSITEQRHFLFSIVILFLSDSKQYFHIVDKKPFSPLI